MTAVRGAGIAMTDLGIHRAMSVRVHVLSTLPRTHAGKIRKTELRRAPSQTAGGW